jgi:hypothetical protein
VEINPPISALTEEWNGTSWTELNDLNTARYGLGAGGTTSAGLAFGGNPGAGIIAATEEWSSSSNTVKTITTS